MKRLVGVFLLMLAFLSAPAQAAFKEGQHYQKVSMVQPVETGDKIEVREFFWYGCPHCYVLEPVLDRWLKKLPANAQFVRTPGVAPRWMTHAQAYYAFESLGVLDKVHRDFFRLVQEQKEGVNDEKAIAEFIAGHGVDKQKFQEAFGSFGVRLKLDKAKQLNQDLNIESVPAFVVDGKYLTNPSMAGSEEAVTQVLDFLIERATKERKKDKVKTKK